MSKVDITRSGQTHALAVGQSLDQLVALIVKQLADGFQPGPDLLAILGGAITPVVQAISNFMAVGDEVKADPLGVKTSLVISADDLANTLMSSLMKLPAQEPVAVAAVAEVAPEAPKPAAEEAPLPA